jgi:hypothetical protein
MQKGPTEMWALFLLVSTLGIEINTLSVAKDSQSLSATPELHQNCAFVAATVEAHGFRCNNATGISEYAAKIQIFFVPIANV